VQHLGLARPNDRTDPYGRGDWDWN
jgi:hypothetical protein